MARTDNTADDGKDVKDVSKAEEAGSASAIERPRTQDLARRIHAAEDLRTLEVLAAGTDFLAGELHDEGVPVTSIAATTGYLNRRLFNAAWSLIAPADLLAHSCLVVMGSEGRQEQLLKTDQDNALILEDAWLQQQRIDDIHRICQRFSEALGGFGYPPCPGNIMLSNPQWCRSVSGFHAQLRQWIYSGDKNGPMFLAILMDAAAVSGQPRLLHEVRHYLEAIVSDHDGFLARFAAAADQFDDSASWWSWLSPRKAARTLDIKKHGTFPVVHGVRALAMQYRVSEASTALRLDALVKGRHLRADVAQSLSIALNTLMRIRMDQQLRKQRAGLRPDNLLIVQDLEEGQRQQLNDALAVVKRFRQFLRQHFRLGQLA